MPSSNFPSGFAAGLNVRGLPLLQAQPGRVFWVDNSSSPLPSVTAGANGNPGTYNRPLSTIQRGFDLASANKGDIVMVKSGHAETIADAVTLIANKAGVAVIGLGSGAMRPRITFSTAATANIPVTAANVSFQNLLFVANFADVASLFTATGTATPTDLNIEGCEFRDTSSVLNALTIVTGNATANSMDGFRFAGNRIKSLGTTAATTAIKLSSATDRVQINDNYYVGAVLNNTAALLAHGANVVTNLEMATNVVFRPNTDTATGGILITTSSTTNSGMVYNNKIQCLDVAAAILVTAGSVYGMMNNLYDGDADASGFVLPAIGVN